MKKINNRWVDENNNSWNCYLYSKEQAIKLSKTMICCSECFDCSDCSRCSDCYGCYRCSDCYGCYRCSDCSSCSRCSDCSDCSRCSDFRSNPQRYTGCKMGSRNSQTITYWNDEKTQVICGCYAGTLEEFQKRVNEVHGNNEYGKQYQKYIKIVKTILDMERDNNGNNNN